MRIESKRLTSFARTGLWAAIACLLLAKSGSAHAELSVLLEQPYGGLALYNPTGHTAVYFDHVCAETPVKLRACHPGELGVVISRYNRITDHDWIAVPLLPYLYAVASPAEIPQSVTRATAAALRDEYRRRYLEEVAPDLPDGGTPPGNWYELVGSAFDRTIYGFTIATTPEQDAELIAVFNDQRNVERYSGAFRNCADFVRTTINSIYPHAIRRNFIADFGLTTPISVARGLSHYASKHPELDLHVFVVPQVKGSLPRSHGVEGVTESLITRYGLPLVVVSPIATAAVFVAYLGHGRFSMPKHPPVLDLRTKEIDIPADSSAEGSPPRDVPLPAAPPSANALDASWPFLSEPASKPEEMDTPMPVLFAAPFEASNLQLLH
jgi:hypothetical protein